MDPVDPDSDPQHRFQINIPPLIMALKKFKHDTSKSQESMLTERLIHDVWIIFTDGLPRGLPLPLEFDWENSSVAAQK